MPLYNDSCSASGGRDGNRTHTLVKEPDFESSASTNSATRPWVYYIIKSGIVV